MSLRRGAPRGVAEHPAALDADDADSHVDVDLSGRGLGVRRERLATRDIGDDRFVVCCAPFFAYDVACGDVVRAVRQAGSDEVPIFDAVVDAGGRTALRVLFTKIATDETRDDCVAAAERCDARVERYTADYLAIDVADSDAPDVVRQLGAYEADGLLHWETAHTA